MKTSDVVRVDPGLMSKNTDLPSSLVMEQDKADASYDSPLAAAEPKYCLTGENCENANEVWHLAPISLLVVTILSILLLYSFLL